MTKILESSIVSPSFAALVKYREIHFIPKQTNRWCCAQDYSKVTECQFWNFLL